MGGETISQHNTNFFVSAVLLETNSSPCKLYENCSSTVHSVNSFPPKRLSGCSGISACYYVTFQRACAGGIISYDRRRIRKKCKIMIIKKFIAVEFSIFSAQRQSGQTKILEPKMYPNSYYLS